MMAANMTLRQTAFDLGEGADAYQYLVYSDFPYDELRKALHTPVAPRISYLNGD
jgi:hypothetical protein